jgi:hypothetical protein
MSAFTLPPFNLRQGVSIIAIGKAFNEIGWGLYSLPSTGSLLVMEAPSQPSSSPVMISQLPNSISVSMPVVTGFLTGGSPILSYNLQYQGVLTPPWNYTTLIGEAPDNLVLQYTKNGLLTDYMFNF